MVTGLEVALVKPVVDALLALYKKAKSTRLKTNAEKALAEAIRELLTASPDLRSTEAKIAVAKAAGIINADLILAQDMVSKHRTPVKKPAAKKAAAKKPALKKPAAKKPALKKPAVKKA